MQALAINPGMGKARRSSGDQKKPGRQRDIGGVVPFNVELPPELDTALEKYKAQHGSTKKFAVIRALEEFLNRVGLYGSENK